MILHRLIATLVFFCTLNVTYAQIKVACVGNSITYGAGIEDRENMSYPVQLQKLLGAEWEVHNFGVSGATMLKSGDKPYWEQQAYHDALALVPDVVVIKLGTNDSKPQNWDDYGSEYVDDYLEMIASFRKVNPDVIIFICLPVPAYEVRWGIREDIIVAEVMPAVKKVKKTAKTKMINLYKPLSDKEEMFPDKIHPNADGAGVMSEVIAKRVSKVRKKVGK